MFTLATATAMAAAATLGLLAGAANPEVPLYPAGQVPGEVPGAVGPEYWDNKTTGNGYTLEVKKNVSAPSITLFLAPSCPAAGCTRTFHYVTRSLDLSALRQ